MGLQCLLEEIESKLIFSHKCRKALKEQGFECFGSNEDTDFSQLSDAVRILCCIFSWYDGPHAETVLLESFFYR